MAVVPPYSVIVCDVVDVELGLVFDDNEDVGMLVSETIGLIRDLFGICLILNKIKD